MMLFAIPFGLGLQSAGRLQELAKAWQAAMCLPLTLPMAVAEDLAAKAPDKPTVEATVDATGEALSIAVGLRPFSGDGGLGG